MSNLGVKNESRIEKKSGTEKRYIKEVVMKHSERMNQNKTQTELFL